MTMRAYSLLLLAFTLPAVELTVRDFRLGAENRPSAFHFSYDSPLTSSSGDDAFDSTLSLEGGGRWSFAGSGDSVGLVLGSSLALDGQHYAGGDGLATAWGRLSAGVGWAPALRWTLIAEAGALYGRSSLRLPETSMAPAFTANGDATAFDGRLIVDYMISRRVGVGLSAGWLVAKHDLTGDDSNITISQSGWFAGLEVVWRLNDAPTRLE